LETRLADKELRELVKATGTSLLDLHGIGPSIRHRLSRAGNRQIKRTLHIMATVQLRYPTEGCAYHDRKKASGKTSMEAMRASSVASPVRHRLPDDAQRRRRALGDGFARTPGNGYEVQRDRLTSPTGSSDESLPGPATNEPTTALPAAC
jgi:transposase